MPRAPARVSFDDLPLFATDMEIARAIVGEARAAEWVKTRLPTLAGKPGFPAIDAFHSGRPTWLIRRFYEQYLGVAGIGTKPGAADGREDAGAWQARRRA